MMDVLEPIRMLDPGWASSYDLLFNRQPEDLPEGRKMNLQSLVTEFGAHFDYRVRSCTMMGIPCGHRVLELRNSGKLALSMEHFHPQHPPPSEFC